jgi:hypothetical protein
VDALGLIPVDVITTNVSERARQQVDCLKECLGRFFSEIARLGARAVTDFGFELGEPR